MRPKLLLTKIHPDKQAVTPSTWINRAQLILQVFWSAAILQQGYNTAVCV